MTFDEQHVFDLSWHLALYSVGSNEGRNPCTCTCATRGTWRGARWISATIEPLELSLICICDGGEVAEASGWVRLILVATVCLRWMMLVVTVVTKELEYQGLGIKENRNAIDEYYPQNTVALQNGSIVKAVGTCEHVHSGARPPRIYCTRRLQNEHFAANQKAEVSISARLTGHSQQKSISSNPQTIMIHGNHVATLS